MTETRKSAQSIIAVENDRVWEKFVLAGKPEAWAKSHLKGWSDALRFRQEAPSHASAIALMLTGLAIYADEHFRVCESRILEDGVLGPEWLSGLKCVRGLLNGKTEPLDPGTLDSMIVKIAESEGFEQEQL